MMTSLERQFQQQTLALVELYTAGENPQKLALPRGALTGSVLFPGAFNPVHSGHLRLAAEVETLTGQSVLFEIGKTHPIKPSLKTEEVINRIRLFPSGSKVLLTENLPRFVDKLAYLPDLKDVILGGDAFERLIAPQFYSSDFSPHDLFELFCKEGIRLYIFDRKLGGRLFTLEQILPNFKDYGNVFVQLPCQEEVSSTDIRLSTLPFLSLDPRHSDGKLKDRYELVHDRTTGLLLGCAIGDALGLPVETLSLEQIRERYGRISKFESPSSNPFTDGQFSQPGTTSDDFQLTIAVAKGLIRSGNQLVPEYVLENLAMTHVESFRRSSVGWGASTIAGAQELIVAGTAKDLLHSDRPERRCDGNGVAMKVAPFAVWMLLNNFDSDEVFALVADFASITHPSSMAISSGFAQVAATHYCLSRTRDTFRHDDFIAAVVEAARKGERYLISRSNGPSLTAKLEELAQLKLLSDSEIADSCGGGSSYVYHSLPFSYAFFLRNPFSIEALFDVVNAGGDTDSNGAIVGGLLGALNGSAIFPATLINDLPNQKEAFEIAGMLIKARAFA